MFCKNCGQAMPDNTKFCAACGTPVEGAAPGQTPAIITNLLARLIGFLKKPLATIGDAAKSNTHEWSILAGINLFFYTIATALCGLEILAHAMDSFKYAGKMYSFFGVYGIAIVVGAAAFFGTSLGLWLLITQVFKKQVSFVNVFNMVSVACLPLTAVAILNMLLGLIYAPLTLVFFVVALLLTAICLFVGVQKLTGEASFYGFAVVMASVAVVTLLLSLLYFVVLDSDGAMLRML